MIARIEKTEYTDYIGKLNCIKYMEKENDFKSQNKESV